MCCIFSSVDRLTSRRSRREWWITWWSRLTVATCEWNKPERPEEIRPRWRSSPWQCRPSDVCVVPLQFSSIEHFRSATLTHFRTEDKARLRNSSCRKGEQKSSKDKDQIRRPEAELMLRSKCAEKTSEGHQKETDTHDRSTSKSNSDDQLEMSEMPLSLLLVSHRSEEDRSTHKANEIDHLNGESIGHSIAHHRPLQIHKLWSRWDEMQTHWPLQRVSVRRYFDRRHTSGMAEDWAMSNFHWMRIVGNIVDILSRINESVHVRIELDSVGGPDWIDRWGDPCTHRSFVPDDDNGSPVSPL